MLNFSEIIPDNHCIQSTILDSLLSILDFANSNPVPVYDNLDVKFDEYLLKFNFLLHINNSF